MIDLKNIPNSVDVSSSNYDENDDKQKVFNDGFYDTYYIKKSSRIPTPPPTASSGFADHVLSRKQATGEKDILVSNIINRFEDEKKDFNEYSMLVGDTTHEGLYSITRNLKIKSAQKKRNTGEYDDGDISQMTNISKSKSLRRFKSMFSFLHRPKSVIEKDKNDYLSNSSFTSTNTSNNNNNNNNKFDTMSFSTDCEVKLKYCWPSTSECLSGSTLTQSKENNRFDVNDYSTSVLSASTPSCSPTKNIIPSEKIDKITQKAETDNSNNSKTAERSLRRFFSLHRSQIRKNDKNIIKNHSTRKRHLRDLFKFNYRNIEDEQDDNDNGYNESFKSADVNVSSNNDFHKRKSIRKKISSFFNTSNIINVSNYENTTMNSSWNPENFDNPYDIAANNSKISLNDIIPDYLLQEDNQFILDHKYINEKEFDTTDNYQYEEDSMIDPRMIFKSPFQCQITEIKEEDRNESLQRKIEINKLVFELDNFNVTKYQHHNGSQNTNERSSSAVFFRSPNFEVEERTVQRVKNNYSNKTSISKF